MELLGYTIAQMVTIFIYVLMIATFIRAIMGWFPISEDSPILVFITKFTDIIVIPVRNIMSKIEYFDSIPFDLSIFISMTILMIFTLFL